MKSSVSEAKEASPAIPPWGVHYQREEWELARRITSTPPFLRSAFLTNFLLYVCDRKLHGRESEISEYQIGMHALGRPSSYHPGEDNIVRNYARILRKRLEEYFATEGRNEPIRVVIPRGQYVPVFELNVCAEAQVKPAPAEGVTDPLPAPIDVAVPARPSFAMNKRIRISVAVLAGVFMVCVLAVWLYSSVRIHPANLYGLFWGEVFNSRRTAYIVTGDSGLALLQELTGREVHLHEYVNGGMDERFSIYKALDPLGSKDTSEDRFADYTSVADLNAVVGFLRLPESSAGQVVVRYARDVRMDDLKQSNVILLGGPHANPWVELFEPISAFRMAFPVYQSGTHVYERTIINKHPRPGEQAMYTKIANADPHLTYTILSFLPSMDGAGHVLLIQGQDMAATRAGADFVLNQRAMTPILTKASTKNGSVGPFEVVLETQAVGASAPEAHPIVERYGVNGANGFAPREKQVVGFP